jgi:hypothetical protein
VAIRAVIVSHQSIVEIIDIRIRKRLIISMNQTAEARDEYGMTAKDWQELNRETKKVLRFDRINALKAIWVPKKAPQKAGRGDEFTILLALKTTIGIILDRRWTDKHEEDIKAKSTDEWPKYLYGADIAYWSSVSNSYSYSSMQVWLYPNFRIQIFQDGESLM